MPRKGGEIDLKPCAHIPVGALYVLGRTGDGVLFVEWTGELPSVAQVKPLPGGAAAKASPNRAFVAGGRPETE